MGIFSDITDTLFGGTDDSSQKKQIKANERTQEFIEEQSAQARGDALNLQPLVDQAFRGGYGSATSMLGGGLERSMDLYGRGNYAAQEALLAGMPQYQNAILGLPVNNAALQPVNLNAQQGMDFMYNPQLPDLGTPTSYKDLLGGVVGTDSQNFADYVQPGKTNRELVSKAYNLGLIDDKTYKQFQETFANSGNGGGQYWAQAGGSGPLINNIQDSTSPQWRGTLENFFQLLYPN